MDSLTLSPVAPVLDLRHLPPPLPLERALAAAIGLLPGEAVTVLTPCLPTPLLEALAREGLQARARQCQDGSGEVRIRRGG